MKKGGLNPKDPLLSQKWSDLRQFFVGQGKKKSHNLKIFKSQYLSDYLRYGQYGVSRHSFIDFRKMAKMAPPHWALEPREVILKYQIWKI